MSWDASATLQLLAILGSIASVGMAWYTRKNITAAGHWFRAKVRHPRCHSCDVTQKQQELVIPRTSSWDDPNIEAGAAISAWKEETRRAIEDCCAERACRICTVATIAKPMKARLRANSAVEAAEANVGRERKTLSGLGVGCA